MKFKMAPNSLFAVLLRSPWWISMVIALGVAAVAFALLPEPYRGLGAMGGFPFIVIGSIALWQQLRLPSAKRSEEILRATAAHELAGVLRFAGRGFHPTGLSRGTLEGSG